MTRDPAREQATVAELLAEMPTEGEYLLPLLQRVQASLGFISQDAIRQIAGAFNLSRADVYGVVTFYKDFRQAPAGEHVIQLCMAEACQSVGCRSLAAHAIRTLGIPLGQTTVDGKVTLEEAYCFGNCALGPTVRIDDRIIGRMTPERLDELIAGLDATRCIELPSVEDGGSAGGGA